MREIFNTLISNVKKFSWRGFLFRKTLLAKLRYIFDLTLVVITPLVFCLAITGAIGGTLALLVLMVLEYV